MVITIRICNILIRSPLGDNNPAESEAFHCKKIVSGITETGSIKMVGTSTLHSNNIEYLQNVKVPPLNKNKKEKDNTKKM